MVGALRKSFATGVALLAAAALATGFRQSPLSDPASSSESRIVTDAAMPSRALHGLLPVTLYLPAAAADVTAPLPVIILLHGVNSQGMDWIVHGQLRQIADRLIAANRMPPTIIAMPSSGTSWYVDSADIGGPGNFDTAIGTELPRWLAQHWNARADRNGRAIAGYSMGGFGALHLAFEHPERWVAAGSMSGTFLTVVGRQAANPVLNQRLIAGAFGVPFRKARLLRASPVTLALTMQRRTGVVPAVFIGCGRRDQLHLAGETADMLAELRGLGVPVSAELIDGGHDWKTWRQLLPDMLTFLADHFDHPGEPSHVVTAAVEKTSEFTALDRKPTKIGLRPVALP
jgi:enterochelin esterase family protein